MTRAQLKAQKVFNDLGIKSHDALIEYLDDICWFYGALVQRKSIGGAEGRLSTNGTKGVITVNIRDSNLHRQRFTIGHELGHFLIHKSIESNFDCNSQALDCWFAKTEYEKREIEANEFSGELLIPSFLLKKDIKNERPDLNLIRNISEKYQLSLTVSAKRIVEVSDEAIAVVLFNKNGVKYFQRSSYFSDLHFFIHKGPISSETYAYDALNGKGQRYMSQVAAAGWIDVKERQREETIKEHSVYYAKFDYGLSILWVDRGELLWK